jgi:Peptidase S46.
MIKKIGVLVLAALLFSTSVAFAKKAPKADEGMWLPILLQKLNYPQMQKMGLKLTAEDLYSINHSSLKDAIVRMGNFCTGEIVSNEGLMFTNHHCGYESINSQSTVEHDYLKNGFWAYSKGEELPIAGLTVSFLVRMEDVTATITKGFNAKQLSSPEAQDSIAARSKVLEKQYSENGHYEVSVETLFEGLEYYMFIYETYKDIRLVGAPPSSIGKFGGDTDNWMWPRHTGDFSIFRVYAGKDNKPADYSKDNVPLTPKHFLPISLKEKQKNDFAMIWGYPGSTSRYMTSGEVANTINVINPSIYKAGSYMLPTMKKLMDKEDRVRLIYASDYAELMNVWKNKQGELRGLKRLDVFDKKKAIEDRLADWISQDNSRQQEYGNVLSELQKANNVLASAKTTKYSWYANIGLMASKLTLMALRTERTIAAMESMQNNKEMSKEQKDAIINTIKTKVKANGDEHYAKYDPATEKELFRAFVQMLYENDKNSQVTKVVNEKFDGNVDKYVEKAFKKSIFATREDFDKFCKNPSAKKLKGDLIVFAAESAIAYFNDENSQKAESNISDARRMFVKALREMDPTMVQYPDANMTMRMTYGSVLDYYPADAVHYDYTTTIDGVMEKEDESSDEFQVPSKLKDLYATKDYGQYANKNGGMTVCFLTNNDITGGNSGSPVINGEGQLMGLAFDGNWEAMSGDIAFEPQLQRTICVDIRYVLFIIDKYAGAKNLIDELQIIK